MSSSESPSTADQPWSATAAALASTGRARAAHQSAQSSSSDARQLAAAFRGISSMIVNLQTYLKNTHGDMLVEVENSADIGPAFGDKACDNVLKTLKQADVLVTYVSSHAQVSEEMAKRAEQRTSDAELAVQEAESDEKKAALASTSLVPTKATKKRKTASSAPAKRNVKAGTAASASTSAPPAAAAAPKKFKPTTKLEKAIAKEIKLLPIILSDTDVTKHSQLKSCLYRLEKLVLDDETSKAEGSKTIVALDGGVDTLFAIPAYVRKCKRRLKGSGDLDCCTPSLMKLLDAFEKHAAIFLTSERIEVLLQLAITPLVSTWGCRGGHSMESLEMVYWAAVAHPVEFSLLINSQTLNEISQLVSKPPEQLRYYAPGCLHHSVSADDHERVVKLLLILAETPSGLAIVSKCMPRDDLLRIVDNHEKKYTYTEKDLYTGLPEECEHGRDCSECCHSSAEKLKKLLASTSSSD